LAEPVQNAAADPVPPRVVDELELAGQGSSAGVADLVVDPADLDPATVDPVGVEGGRLVVVMELRRAEPAWSPRSMPRVAGNAGQLALPTPSTPSITAAAASATFSPVSGTASAPSAIPGTPSPSDATRLSHVSLLAEHQDRAACSETNPKPSSRRDRR